MLALSVSFGNFAHTFQRLIIIKTSLIFCKALPCRPRAFSQVAMAITTSDLEQKCVGRPGLREVTAIRGRLEVVFRCYICSIAMEFKKCCVLIHASAHLRKLLALAE